MSTDSRFNSNSKGSVPKQPHIDVNESTGLEAEFERYQRQMMVAQIGREGQKKLAASHVVIVGMGGLGCPASLFLAGAGVGRLTLIDHDTVSLTNLHRQILYREADVGKFKAAVAHQSLSRLNSDIEITSLVERVTAANIDEMLSTADMVVDASDNFALSYLLSDYCLAHCKPLVSASVIGVTGYVGVFCRSTVFNGDLNQKNGTIPSMRTVFPNPPPVGQDCNSVGVVGTAAGIMGTLQAQEVIKVILGDVQQLAGRLLSLNLWNYRQTIMDFSAASEPDNYAKIIAEKDIDSDERSRDWVVDVRSDDEVAQQPKFAHQHLPTNNIVLDSALINTLPQDKRLVFRCASGARALMVADKALAAGFDDVAVWL